MADKEMYDYLSTVNPTYTTTTLSVKPKTAVAQRGKKSQIVHEFDDGSIAVVAINDNAVFDVTLQWDMISTSDAGTILDFWHDANKANGRERSFYWTHPVDGHTYVAHFLSELDSVYHYGWNNRFIEIQQITLRLS